MSFVIPITCFASAGLVITGGLEIMSKLKWVLICLAICLFCLLFFTYESVSSKVWVVLIFFSIWLGGDLGIHLNNNYPKLKFKKK